MKKNKSIPLSLKKDPLVLLAALRLIKDKRVRDHVHFSLYWRWEGSKADKAIFRADMDMVQGLDALATAKEMREALHLMGAPKSWYKLLVVPLEKAPREPCRMRRKVSGYRKDLSEPREVRLARQRRRKYWTNKLI